MTDEELAAQIEREMILDSDAPEWAPLAWGKWDDHERRLAQYAAEYHERCEAYDRTVCTARSPRTGAAIPATTREQALINSHALSVVDDIVKRTSVDRQELWRVISGR